MTERSSVGARTVVLVHGGFVDGSGWEGVYNILRKDGYTVAVVQNPTISLADDVAATKRIIAAQTDPVVLVGHSYGGVVITEAGNDPKVAALVSTCRGRVPRRRRRVERLVGFWATPNTSLIGARYFGGKSCLHRALNSK